MIRFALFLATFVYVGYVPFASGTFGSAAGIALDLALRQTGIPWIEPAAVFVLSALGVWAATIAERHFGGIDPGPVVIDEVVGQIITMAFIPLSPLGILVAFLLFRVFDIVKPWPAGRLERLPGGYGVIGDDAMAGLYAHVVLRAAAWAAPGWLLADQVR